MAVGALARWWTVDGGWHGTLAMVDGGTVNGNGTLTDEGQRYGERQRYAHDDGLWTVGGDGVLTTVVQRTTGGTLAATDGVRWVTDGTLARWWDEGWRAVRQAHDEGRGRWAADGGRHVRGTMAVEHGGGKSRGRRGEGSSRIRRYKGCVRKEGRTRGVKRPYLYYYPVPGYSPFLTPVAASVRPRFCACDRP